MITGNMWQAWAQMHVLFSCTLICTCPGLVSAACLIYALLYICICGYVG
jgi:hypothetical protein